jgi:hypothetical protein
VSYQIKGGGVGSVGRRWPAPLGCLFLSSAGKPGYVSPPCTYGQELCGFTLRTRTLRKLCTRSFETVMILTN